MSKPSGSETSEFRGFREERSKTSSKSGSSVKSNKKESLLRRKKQIELEIEKLRIEEELSQTENENDAARDAEKLSGINVEDKMKETQNWVDSQNASQQFYETDQPKLMKLMSNILLRQNIKADLPEFNGDTKDWISFFTQFKETTEKLQLSDNDNMIRLRTCLKGEARKCVEGLLISSSQVPKIMTILERRFGKPEIIIRTLIEDLKNRPFVKSNDFRGFVKFADTISNLISTLEAMESNDYLNCPQLLDEILQKLPYNSQLAWGKKLIRENKKKSLLEFGAWIQDEAEAIDLTNLSNLKTSLSTVPSHLNSNKRNNFVLATVGRNRHCQVCKGDHSDLTKCTDFLQMEVKDRWNMVVKKKLCFSCLKENHRINDCKKKINCGINGCQKPHNKLLHKDVISEETNTHSEESNTHIIANTTKLYNFNQVMLRIAPVTIHFKEKIVRINALFDEGSTVTIVDEDLADELQLNGQETPLNLKWTDKNSKKKIWSKMVSFTIENPRGEKYRLENVYTYKDLELPISTVTTKNFTKHYKHLVNLSVEDLPIPGERPKLLIGQDNWELITTRELFEGNKNTPALSRTKLGWVIHGKIRGRIDNFVLVHRHQENEADQILHEEIKSYFSNEAFGVTIQEKTLLSAEDMAAKQILETTTRRIEGDNRWETGLLWKTNVKSLPDNMPNALQRLHYTEKRMKKDPRFAEAYSKKIEEFVEKGYAKKLTKEEKETSNPRTWYLPHFGVVNPNKPNKLRLVFDAAATYNGTSLNSALLRGPDYLISLNGILLKFREKAIAFGADIKEMFPQVRIIKDDRAAQRFLWRRPEQVGNPDIYEMQAMIFGAICSPSSAQFVKNKNALEFQKEYPEAVDAIINKHYMDDYLDSLDNEENAIKIIREVIEIHTKGGFTLCNWISNSKKVLMSIPDHLRTESNKNISTESKMSTERILGLWWEPNTDIFIFKLNSRKIGVEILEGRKIPTKRELLRIIMSIFDPLGMLGLLTIRGKILLQEIWKKKVGWDEEIPENSRRKFKKLMEQMKTIETLKIPRCYFNSRNGNYRIELHIFCDASEQAYATIGYFRLVNEERIEVTMVMSRTHVSPLHPVTIPRLELQAAVMASRLAITIKREHTYRVDKTYFWTDSQIVLSWIRKAETTRFKTFVNHRIAEILENSLIEEWFWVPSKENVADLATRDRAGLPPMKNWLQGPDFLLQTEKFWPKEDASNISKENLKEEMKQEYVIATTTQDSNINFSYLPEITHFSKLTYLLRSTAYVIRFLNKCKRRIVAQGEFTREELQKAEMLWCQKCQHDSFEKEINCLKNQRQIERTSLLYQLSPQLDEEEQVIRLKGRISSSNELDEETKNPIILKGTHAFTILLIEHYHRIFAHNGRETVLNQLRQKYWITRGRRAVAKVFKNCNLCRKLTAQPLIPEMGQLPTCRLKQPQRPFTYTGVDYFGPMNVTVGRKHDKRYGVLFTCLSIRAIHIEIAENLSTDSMILALRRFIARRGEPKSLFSDNGTNFKGAEKDLTQLLKSVDEDLIKRELVKKKIEWNFIPPGSPHMGGAWERMIRSVKTTLRIILKERYPRTETLSTVLTEVENIVNSRPITYVSEDPEDPESLTPNHFLIGPGSNAKSPGILNETSDLKKQWRLSQNLTNMFWNRWLKEYLLTLTKRTKWFADNKNLKVNELVIIVDGTLPRNNWPMGRIVQIYPGKDGKVRVVDVKTKMGIFRRPVNKLCPLSTVDV